MFNGGGQSAQLIGATAELVYEGASEIGDR
jgi:hypothetical protein